MKLTSSVSTSIFVTTLLFGLPAEAQYDQGAERCVFDARASKYGYLDAPVKNGGQLYIEWEPESGELLAYRWFFDPDAEPNTDSSVINQPKNLYSEFVKWEQAYMSPWIPERPALVFDATVMSRFHDVRNHIHARLFFAAGASSPEWHFAGLLQQSGTGWITAAGEVHCSN